MLLLIDNYDSFTYNLYHILGASNVKIEVRRNDALTVEEALALNPDGLPLIAAAAAGRLPLLGVCLGHQAIGQAFGGRVVRAPVPMHGKVGKITHQGRGILAGLPSPFDATRYHSLIVERESLPDCLEVTAETVGSEGEAPLIMALAHRTLPIHGVQFHPESIASQYGAELLGNFLALSRSADAAR